MRRSYPKSSYYNLLIDKNYRVCMVTSSWYIFFFAKSGSRRARSLLIPVHLISCYRDLCRQTGSFECSAEKSILLVVLGSLKVSADDNAAIVRWLSVAWNHLQHNDSFLQCYRKQGRGDFLKWKYQKYLYAIILIKLNKPFTNVLL